MKLNYVNDWVPEVGSLLRRLLQSGFTLKAGNNGGDDFRLNERPEGEPFISLPVAEFIAELIAADEFHLYVVAPDGKRLTLYCVLGNSPGELVCDHSGHPLLEVVTSAHYEWWNGKPQPTKLDPHAEARRSFNAVARANAELVRRANWSLLELHAGANKVLHEVVNTPKDEAIALFATLCRKPLNSEGYFKDGETSYCIAEGL